MKDESKEVTSYLDSGGIGDIISPDGYTITSNHRIGVPLQMEWQPKEDITTYELALCMQYLVGYGAVMPYDVDLNDKHFRHFKITNHNE